LKDLNIQEILLSNERTTLCKVIDCNGADCHFVMSYHYSHYKSILIV